MPQWLENAIFYEIYPQSFYDSNNDGIGDIVGIQKKLPYIQELGANAIWINPCFVSPFSDAGYDVADFKKVAPRYGTNEDLKALFEAAHQRNMHVLLDLVPGHTSIDHPWFTASKQAEKNEYSNRYIWTNSVWEDMNNCHNICGNLRGIFPRDGSCAINFFSSQPCLNYGFANLTADWQLPTDHPDVLKTRAALKDIMRFWLQMGCDGFRVDMAGSLIKDDVDGSANIALWQDIRAFLDQEFPQAAMVSEWGEPDQSLKAGFHMDFLLHFGPSHYLDLFRETEPYFARKGTGNVADFVKKYKENYEKTHGKGLMCLPSGNHDMLRINHTLDTEETKLAFAFLLSMPGAPFIYYGDEIGMRYQEGLPSKEGGYNRTGSRTPMQWDDTENAGFSGADAANLYLPIDPNPARNTVKKQREEPQSLWREIHHLIQIRNAHKALQSSSPVTFLYAEEYAYPFIYERKNDEETIWIILNPSDQDVTCPISLDTGTILYQNGPSISFPLRVIPKASCYFILCK